MVLPPIIDDQTHHEILLLLKCLAQAQVYSYVILSFNKHDDVTKRHSFHLTFQMTLTLMYYLTVAEVDLSDENGNIKNLRDFPEKYANELLGERERLVLIRVDSKCVRVWDAWMRVGSACGGCVRVCVVGRSRPPN